MDGETRQAHELYEALLTPSHASAVRAGALDALLRLEPGLAEQRIHRLLRGEEPLLQPDAVLRPVAIAAVVSGSLWSSILSMAPITLSPIFEYF